ncbi:zinc ribbon domain-containing protein [Breoghania sp.]|uniref:zinc ribbon domain-containing protein n=1 Tax=Breoghania sp. TaxID=2065378 RepID=UPI002AAC3A48|nr:zinc ribbon domain-containing protein [Breoghania sp.]
MSKPTMIECPSCEHKVSVSANSCPQCGAVLRKPKRGIFGKIVIFAFWAFNLLMVVWIWGGTQSAVESSKGLSGAEAAGAAIGTGLGITLLVIIWLIGAILLGLMALLTRPK